MHDPPAGVVGVEIDINGLHFVVLRADRQRLYTLLVTRLPDQHADG